MREIGIAQDGEPSLTEVASRFNLPGEADDVRRIVAQLAGLLERVSQVHTFSKGMGLAAPQIGIGRAATIVRTPTGEQFTLLNPRIIEESGETSEQYEGCLSFFDVRGMVPRPSFLAVEHQDIDGTMRITEFTGGVARLVAHEIDHLNGVLYRSRMRSNLDPIPVSEYRGTGKPWS